MNLCICVFRVFLYSPPSVETHFGVPVDYEVCCLPASGSQNTEIISQCHHTWPSCIHFGTALHSLGYYSSVVDFKDDTHISSNFFFKTIPGYSVSFAFPNLFRNSLSISAKKSAEISCRDCVKLVSHSGRKPSQQAYRTTLLISRICIFFCSIQSLCYFH